MKDDGLQPKKLERGALLELRRRLDLEDDLGAPEPLHVSICRTFFAASLVQVNRTTKYEGGGPEEVLRIWTKTTTEFCIVEPHGDGTQTLDRVLIGHYDEDGQYVTYPEFDDVPNYHLDIDAAIGFKNSILDGRLSLGSCKCRPWTTRSGA